MVNIGTGFTLVQAIAWCKSFPKPMLIKFHNVPLGVIELTPFEPIFLQNEYLILSVCILKVIIFIKLLWNSK